MSYAEAVAQLAQATARLDAAQTVVEQARAQRDEALRAAREAGMGVAEMQKVTRGGLSRASLYRILQRE